jgi:putative ribosome biogenesis GTPase RsgA
MGGQWLPGFDTCRTNLKKSARKPFLSLFPINFRFSGCAHVSPAPCQVVKEGGRERERERERERSLQKFMKAIVCDERRY